MQNSQLLDPLLPFPFFATTWCIYLRQPVDILDETILIKCNHDNKFQSISAKNYMNPSNNGILFPKLFWPSVRKSCSCDGEKTFEIRGWRPRNCKKFKITRTICLNSERSEQFLVTEWFFNLFLEVSYMYLIN